MRAWLIAPCLGAALLALPCATAEAGRGDGFRPHVRLSAPFHIAPRSRSVILVNPRFLANPRFVDRRFRFQRFGVRRFGVERHRRFSRFTRSSDFGFGGFGGFVGLPDVGPVVEGAAQASPPEAAAPPGRLAVAGELPPCHETVAGVLVTRGMSCAHGNRSSGGSE